MGSRKYSTPVDVWSIGCIFAEMSNGRPLVTGTSEVDQLDRIFRLFGTPTRKTYPSISDLPDYTPTLPEYPVPPSLSPLVPALCSDGVDLLERMMRYNPAARITAQEALEHRFFSDVGKG